MRHPLPMCFILPQGGQRKREEREEKGKAGKEERKRGNENTQRRGNKGKHFYVPLSSYTETKKRERKLSQERLVFFPSPLYGMSCGKSSVAAAAAAAPNSSGENECRLFLLL